MSRLLFVDTSAWVGLADRKDRYHTRALKAFERAEEDGAELVTSDYIIAETVTRIRRQSDPAVAAALWSKLESGDAARVVEIERDHRKEARRLLEKYSQIELSIVDCVSMAVMRQFGITDALTFNPDFAKAGFTTIPVRASEETLR